MLNKGKYFIICGLSLCVVALYSFGSHAQYYNQRPNLERRLDRLERQVQDLQAQVNRLEQQAGNWHRGPQLPPAQWTCHLDANGVRYSSTRPTRAEATARALEKCRAGTIDAYCVATYVSCDNT